MKAVRAALRSLPAQAALFAVAYFAFARAGLLLATHHEEISSVWPASGLYLGVLLVAGRRRWPALVAAAFVGDLAANLVAGNGTISVGIAAVDASEGLLAAIVAVWVGGLPFTLRRVRQTVGLVLGGAGAATALVAFGGAAILSLGSGEPLWHSWVVWWSADAVGMLALTPAICATLASPLALPTRRRLGEGLLLLTGLALCSVLVFVVGPEVQGTAMLCLPFLLWLAWRSGAAGAAIGSLLLCTMAVLFTVHGLGPFAGTELSENQQLLSLQLFLAVSVVTALALAAAVSERREATRQLARERSRLSDLLARNESILNSTGEGIWGIGRDGKAVFANEVAAELTGYTLEELIGADTHWLVHHTRADGTPYPVEECPVQNSLMTGRTQHVSDEVYFHKDGTSFPVEYTSTPIRENGDTTGAVVVFRDISQRHSTQRERAKLEHRLAQSQRLESVGQLAGGIAHDFNNLLAVIINYAGFVREELGEKDSIRGDVEEIERAAERAAALTRQLLVFSRLELIEPEVLDLNAVVAGTETLLRRTIGEDIELHTKLAKELPAVKADSGQIEQVVLNLAINARDAMPQGGTLTIETHSEESAAHPAEGGGRQVCLTVTDTGCGMAEEVAARAFEPFFSTKPRHQGSGLGLATVYGIVAQAGGMIDLDSSPGRGTTVELKLPATAEHAVPSPTPRAGAAQPAAGTEVILLVEDEHAVREATRRILTRHGHRVISAASAQEAMRVFAKLGPAIALLVTDVVMPEMSGKELVERIRQDHPGLHVLYMSGYTDDIVSRHGVLDPGFPFLQKPFDAAALLDGVQQALRGSAGEIER